MKWQKACILAVVISYTTTGIGRAQSTDYFAGLYGGFEGGAISFNTQITYDGVDDPAGRGDVMYGVFLGYNQLYEKLLVGVELSFNGASHPEPYTLEPATVGFVDLDLQRGVNLGLDVRGGYLLVNRLLVSGSVGYSINRQAVRIDGVPLAEFEGGAADAVFGTLQFGAGLEVAVSPSLGIRTTVRTFTGHDLSVSDFGTIATDASVNRLDVEPSEQQFLLGVYYRL